MNTVRRNDLDLGLKLVTGLPEGEQDYTEEQLTEWLKQRDQQSPFDKRFRNYQSHFLLDWTDPDIPDPLYANRDLDLQLIAFPEVESPYKFPESIFKRNTKPLPPSGWLQPSEDVLYPEVWDNDGFVIKPPIWGEDLSLLNPDIEIRKLSIQKEPSEEQDYNFFPDKSISTHYGIRVYAEANESGEMPIRCVTHGQIHNLKAKTKVMCAPISWAQEQYKNLVYGIGKYPYIHEALGIGVEMTQYDDSHWSWYNWDDGDSLRMSFQKLCQEDRIPNRGQGYSMILNDVPGMSLGGNAGKIWMDDVYLNGISKVNHHRMFREVSHCYKTDKCNFCGVDGQVNKIEDAGYADNLYAGLDDERYCRYRKSPADISWQSRVIDNLDWDYFCKYLGIPQRAYEYDNHYKDLISSILLPFRNNGVYYWLNNQTEGNLLQELQISGNQYALNSIAILSAFAFGQYKYFNSSTYIVRSGTEQINANENIFYYTVPKPVSAEGTIAYDEELIAHKNSRIFARIWQYNDITSQFEIWLVELKDDYVSPVVRVSEFEVVEDFIYGDDPYIKDRRFAGRNNGGLREYMVRDQETNEWTKADRPYEIASDGFYNLEGGSVMVTGTETNFDNSIWSVISGENLTGIGKPSPVYVDNLPPVLAQGRVRAYGLPGEVIKRDVVCWTQPTVIKWLHIKELRDRLLSPTDSVESPLSAMEILYDKSDPPNDIGIKRLPELNHILQGSVEGGGSRKIQGNGMVSNGDTPYSDILLASDILHTRNLAISMMSYKLTPHIPHETAEYFNETVQDIMSRTNEPHHLSVQRFGYREPAIYTFMRNYKDGKPLLDDVFYTLFVPSHLSNFGSLVENTIGYSDGGANRILRVFHPNGMRWWRDNGFLGAGVQWGEPGPIEGFVSNSTRFNEGSGFKQEGMAIINLFRKNIPLDKEVVRAYLRLVPMTALQMGSQVVETAGGAKQFTVGNDPFVNVDFQDSDYLDTISKMRRSTFYGQVEYEAAIYWKEEHKGSLEGFEYDEVEAFGEAYENSKAFMGDFNFEYENNFWEDNSKHKVSKPNGTGDNDYFTWKKWDVEKTKEGNTLDDVVVSVSAPNVGGAETTGELTTGQRSLHWYKDVYPDLLEGLHSKTDVHNLNTRLDYDENGDAQSNGAGRGYGFACSSGGWAKDWRMFDITDIVRLAYAQDRFSAKYFSVVDKGLSDHKLITLSSLVREEEDELSSIGISERVNYYTGDKTTLAGLFVNYEETPTVEASSKNEYNIIGLEVSLKQLLKQKSEDENSDVVLPPTEDQIRKNYIVKNIKITVRGGIIYTPNELLTLEEQVKLNPNFLLIMGQSPHESLGRVHSGWKYISSVKMEPTDDQTLTTIDFNVAEGNIEQYRNIKIITNADAITEIFINGHYLREDPHVAPITSPPLSEIHVLDKSIQERIANCSTNATAATIIPIKFPITKIYEVLMHVGPNGYNNTSIRTQEGGCIKLNYKGMFTGSLNLPSFTWNVDDLGNYYIDSGEYMYSSSMNAIILPPMVLWDIQEKVATEITKISGLYLSIQYNSGRGSVAKVLVEAENTGPAYDIDPEAICEISESSLSKLSDPSIINPDFYGTSDKLIPFSVTNPKEFSGGYVRGTMPEIGHAFFTGSSFKAPKELQNSAWLTKCKGIVEVYGEPNIEIPSLFEVIAPDFVEHFDPVTGEALSSGFKYSTGLDADSKKPNGGRTPASILINLMLGGSALQNPNGNEYMEYSDDDTFRKKQIAFMPELYIYLRERVDCLELGDTTWSLNFGE